MYPKERNKEKTERRRGFPYLLEGFIPDFIGFMYGRALLSTVYPGLPP